MWCKISTKKRCTQYTVFSIILAFIWVGAFQNVFAVHINTDIDFKGKQKSFDFITGKKLYVKDKKITFEGKIPELAGGWVIISVKDGVDRKIVIAQDGAWFQKIDFKDNKTSTVTIDYYDKDGNKIESDKYKIKVDTEDPEFTDLPSRLIKRPGDRVWWKVQDDSDIKEYKYYFRGKKEKTSSSHFNIPKNTPRGTYTLEVRVYDKAGNSSSKKVQIVVQ